MPLASRPCNLPDGVRFEEISGDSWSPWSICQSRTHRTSTKGKFIKMQDFFHKIQIPGKSAASCIPSFLQIHASEFPLCIFCGPVVAAPLLREKCEKRVHFRSILAQNRTMCGTRPNRSLPGGAVLAFLAFSTSGWPGSSGRRLTGHVATSSARRHRSNASEFWQSDHKSYANVHCSRNAAQIR